MREALYCLREESVLRGSVFVCVGPTVDGSRPCLAAFHTKNEQAHLWILIYVCMHIPQTSAARRRSYLLSNSQQTVRASMRSWAGQSGYLCLRFACDDQMIPKSSQKEIREQKSKLLEAMPIA